MRPFGMLKGDIVVPSVNSAANTYMYDVIGNKTDDELGNSLLSKAYISETHVHSVSEVYPPFSVSPAINVISSAAAYAHGALTQIIPINTIAASFDIHWINIHVISATGVYELKLYYGAADTLAATVQFAKTAVMDSTKEHQCMTLVIPANSVVKASLASSNAAADTVDITLQFHRY